MNDESDGRLGTGIPGKLSIGRRSVSRLRSVRNSGVALVRSGLYVKRYIGQYEFLIEKDGNKMRPVRRLITVVITRIISTQNVLWQRRNDTYGPQSFFSFRAVFVCIRQHKTRAYRCRPEVAGLVVTFQNRPYSFRFCIVCFCHCTIACRTVDTMLVSIDRQRNERS